MELDFEHLLESFSRGEKEWHRKEWLKFIDLIRKDERERVVDAVENFMNEIDGEGDASLEDIGRYGWRDLKKLLHSLKSNPK